MRTPIKILGWRPMETAPKDGTEVALLFEREIEFVGHVYPRVRGACWVQLVGRPGDWSVPYYRNNPPIAWHAMPEAPNVEEPL